MLARATGKYLVQHVYERVAGCPGVGRVIVATDSGEVVEACRSFGAEVALTSPEHASGTDRVAEVARSLAEEIVVNVQGDEPLIRHEDIERLLELFRSGSPEGRAPRADMTTLCVERRDAEGFRDPNIVKVVFGRDGRALYFSRSPVPYADPAAPAGRGAPWYQHVGIYGYRREALLEIARLEPTALEKRERLEQLRALEGGFAIRVGVTTARHAGIDTEEQYRAFVAEYLEGRV